MLKRRKLGSQGLDVSTLGLGCMGMSHAYGGADKTVSIATLHRAIALGCNFYDTAEAYGPFTNETLLGEAFAGCRDEVVIATMTPGDCGSGEHAPEQIAAIRRREAATAAAILGARYICAEFRDLAVFNDEPSRRRVTEILRRARPEVVLAAAPEDPQCDHQAAGILVLTDVEAQGLALPDLAGQLVLRPDRDQLAVVDDAHPVGELLRLLHVVGRIENSCAGTAEFLDRVEDAPPALRVHAHGGLVHEHQPRLVEEAGPDVHPPLHTPRRAAPPMPYIRPQNVRFSRAVRAS